MQNQRNKSTCVGSSMTTLVKVWMSSLLSIMSICRQKELNVDEGSACRCSHPMWKLTSHMMAEKVSQTTSWVPMHSLLWAQRKRWIPIRSMGHVHTHWMIHAIKELTHPQVP
jgi:hypothetical protein